MEWRRRRKRETKRTAIPRPMWRHSPRFEEDGAGVGPVHRAIVWTGRERRRSGRSRGRVVWVGCTHRSGNPKQSLVGDGKEMDRWKLGITEDLEHVLRPIGIETGGIPRKTTGEPKAPSGKSLRLKCNKEKNAFPSFFESPNSTSSSGTGPTVLGEFRNILYH